MVIKTRHHAYLDGAATTAPASTIEALSVDSGASDNASVIIAHQYSEANHSFKVELRSTYQGKPQYMQREMDADLFTALVNELLDNVALGKLYRVR